MLLIQCFKFWSPPVFNNPTVISWNVNSKLLRPMHCMLSWTCALHVWHNNRLYQSWNVSRTCGHYFSACFWLCSCEHVYISQLSCMMICRTAGYRIASRCSKNLLVLIHPSAVRKDLTDLLACGIMKFLWSQWCLLCIIRLGYSTNESYWCEKTERVKSNIVCGGMHGIIPHFKLLGHGIISRLTTVSFLLNTA